MKYLLHIPTEQYGFVSLEFENDIEPELVAELYRKQADAFKPKPVNEMDSKDFNAILDDLLDDYSIAGDPGEVEKMSPVQARILNEIKKSIKRLNK